MFRLGLPELLMIIAIIFLIFGGKVIPQLARGVGLSVRNFRKSLHEPDAIDITPKKEKGTSGEKSLPKKPS